MTTTTTTKDTSPRFADRIGYSVDWHMIDELLDLETETGRSIPDRSEVLRELATTPRNVRTY
jgi:hypothetical protein